MIILILYYFRMIIAILYHGHRIKMLSHDHSAQETQCMIQLTAYLFVNKGLDAVLEPKL